MKEQQSANTVLELPFLVDFVYNFLKDSHRSCPRLDKAPKHEEINALLFTPSFGVLHGSGGHLFCYVENFSLVSHFDSNLLRETMYSVLILPKSYTTALVCGGSFSALGRHADNRSLVSGRGLHGYQ